MSSCSESEAESKPCTEDSEYFLRHDPMVIFLVENTLFKIHRHFLMENSPVFKTMFDCPPEREIGEEGLTKDNPIHLPSVSVVEFKILLNYFYKPQVRSVELTREGLDTRLHLLSIATRFDFDKIRNEVIADLTDWRDYIDPIERIILAEKHDIQRWLVPAYYQLCFRKRSLEEDEAISLGYKATVLAARLREKGREICDSRPDKLWTARALESIQSRKDVLRRIVPEVYIDDQVLKMVKEVLGFVADQYC